MAEKMFISNLPAVTIAVNAASLKALIAAADQGRNQTVQNLSGTRSGRVYRLNPNKRGPAGGRARFAAGDRSADVKHAYYTASAPGEYPAIQWGDLKSSIDRKVVKDEVQVGTALEHGLILEKKAPSDGGREWLRPSLEQAKPAMLAQLAKRWF